MIAFNLFIKKNVKKFSNIKVTNEKRTGLLLTQFHWLIVYERCRISVVIDFQQIRQGCQISYLLKQDRQKQDYCIVEIGLLVGRNRTGKNQLPKVVLFRPVLFLLSPKTQSYFYQSYSVQSYFTVYQGFAVQRQKKETFNSNMITMSALTR